MKTRIIIKTNFDIVAKFFWKNVICRHKIFEKLIIDEDFENKKKMKKLIIKFKIKRVIVFDYHFQINEMIKRDHKFIVNALVKITNKKITNWIENLSIVFWTDRITVRQNIEYTSFYFNCDYEIVMFIELNISIWRILS